VEVDSGRATSSPPLFRTGRASRPALQQPRTRGALAAWLGNHLLLPCRAWGHARYEVVARPVQKKNRRR